MAAKPSQELRIVIIGNAGDEKNKVVRSVLNCENLTGVKVGLCTLHQREQAGRRITVVEAPGWDRISTQRTPEYVKEDLDRSVSLFPAGPHVFLLVIPVKTLSEEPSASEITAAQKHMELLSERVWKHTILLFACDEGVEEPQIKEHIHSSEEILQKCGRQYHVLQKSAQTELLKKIDDLVQENHGDFFIPQAYYELIQHKTQKASGETEIRQRRASLDNPTNFNKDKADSGEKKESGKSDKHTSLEDTQKISIDVKILVLIFMGVIGALFGAVAGAESGVSGSCSGLVFGVIVGVLLASVIMCIYTRIYLRSYPKKPAQCTS